MIYLKSILRQLVGIIFDIKGGVGMRDLHNVEFIKDLTSEVGLESYHLHDMVNLVEKVIAEGSVRRDILELGVLSDLSDSLGEHELNYLTYTEYAKYFEYVGDDEFMYVIDELDAAQGLFVQRIRVYKNNWMAVDRFLDTSDFTEFDVDHLAAYMSDVSKGLSR